MRSLLPHYAWTDDEHDMFMFRRINLVLWPTGCRLSELIGNSDLACFTFELLSWSISEEAVTNPALEQLMSLGPKVDFSRLTPPRSKPDQFGEVDSPFPIILMFDLQAGNAAAAFT